MANLVLAFPELSVHDFNIIQEFRKINDESRWKIVKPHFTLVFPLNNISQEEFISEITSKSSNFTQFNFQIRFAAINKDAFNDYFYIFLVPDEGHSQLVKIHDTLYSGLLRNHLHLDIDYIPHITIGGSPDRFRIKNLADLWNCKEIIIDGRVNNLTIVKFENNLIQELKVIEMK